MTLAQAVSPEHSNRRSGTLLSSRHLPALDGVRGFAVLTVLLFHVGGGSQSTMLAVRAFGDVLRAGWTGVTIFFVLSGFLITGILWDSKGQPKWWRRFYLRRALRIFPLYYLALVLVLISAAILGTFHTAITRVWSTALFLQNFPGIFKRNMLYPGSPLVLRHFWSLAVEEQFYLLWPFLLLLQRSRRSALRLCVAVFLFSALFRLVVWTLSPDPDRYIVLLFTRGGEMAAGAWLAIAFRDALWERIKPYAFPITIAGFGIFALTSWLHGTAREEGALQMVIGLPAVTIGCAGLLVLAIQDGATAHAFGFRPLRWLGRISYGVYVYQLLLMPLYEWIATQFTHSTSGTRFFVIRAIVTTVLTLLVSEFSFRFFEAPILKLKRFVAALSHSKVPVPAN